MSGALRRAGIWCLTLVLALGGAGVTGFAAGDLRLMVDGEPVEADMYIEDGRAHIDAAVLEDLLAEDFDPGYLPLREVLEARGARVSWDCELRVIKVDTGREEAMSAREIALKAETYMLEQNTYRMRGEGRVQTRVEFPELAEPETRELRFAVDGKTQYEPLRVHIKRNLEVPLEQQEDPPAPTRENGDAGAAVTESFMTSERMYQKHDGLWVAVDHGAMGMEDVMLHLSSLDPTRTLEGAGEYGVGYTRGEDVQVEGRDHYQVSMHLDEDALAALWQGTGATGASGDSEVPAAAGEEPAIQEGPQKSGSLSEEMKLRFNYTVVVDQETFATARVQLDINSSLQTEEEVEGQLVPVAVQSDYVMKLRVFDYGQEHAFPDMADSISWDEFLKLQQLHR